MRKSSAPVSVHRATIGQNGAPVQVSASGCAGPPRRRVAEALNMQERLDALVAGAGTAGRTIACELQRGGLRVRVVDTTAEDSHHSKALMLQVRTLAVFERMGVLPPSPPSTPRPPTT